MRVYKNKYVRAYEFKVPVVVYCSLGENYYQAIAKIDISKPHSIVDFIDLENFFKKELNGQRLTAEDLGAKIKSTLQKYLRPKKISVEIISNSHFEIHTFV